MRLFKTSIKVIISLGLLSYLIYLAKPNKILEVLSHIWYNNGIIYLLIAFILFALALLMFAFRWQVLVKGYGIKISSLHLYKFYLIGLFFNNFLPTGIGGDVLRIYNLIQVSGARTVGFASVMTERLLGVTSTLFLTLVALIILFKEFNVALLLYITILLLLFLALFFFSVFNDRIYTLISNFVKPVKVLRIGERIVKFLDALRYYRENKMIYLRILLYSLLGQCLIILMCFILALALDLSIGLEYMFLVVPVTFLLAMMPSINGLGFREGGYVILLAKIGISKAAALSLSFLTILVPILISLIGGVLFLFQKRITKKEEIEIVQDSI